MKSRVDRAGLAKERGYRTVREMYIDLYIHRELPSTTIHKLLGISQATIIRDLRRYGIEVRNCGMRFSA